MTFGVMSGGEMIRSEKVIDIELQTDSE